MDENKLNKKLRCSSLGSNELFEDLVGVVYIIVNFKVQLRWKPTLAASLCQSAHRELWKPYQRMPFLQGKHRRSPRPRFII